MNKLFTKAKNELAIRKMDAAEAEEGATMVEYGLLVVGIAVVVGAAALTLGGRHLDDVQTASSDRADGAEQGSSRGTITCSAPRLSLFSVP